MIRILGALAEWKVRVLTIASGLVLTIEAYVRFSVGPVSFLAFWANCLSDYVLFVGSGGVNVEG